MNKNKYLRKIIALGVIAAATAGTLFSVTHGQAQSTTSPDVLAAEALAALKARNHAQSIALLQRRVQMLIEQHGALAPQVAAASKDLADVQDHYADALYGAGKYAEALVLYRQVLAERERRTGSESADTATSLNDVAKTLARSGLYADALPLYQRALAIAEKVQGPHHATTGMRLDNLARLYGEMGLYAKAEPLFLRALEIAEKALGPEHPGTSLTRNNLAGLYLSMGQYAKAEPLYLRVLQADEKHLGTEHLDTAISLNNLAELYKLMGQNAKAEPLLLRAVAIDEKVRGPEHPDTGISLSNLAGLYMSMGHYPKAELLYQRALSVTEKALGPEHPATGVSLNNLAQLYQATAQYARVEPLLQRALAIAEKVLGPEHPATAIRLGNLAGLYQSLGQYAKAEPLYLRALSIGEKSQGPEHPSTGTRLNNLAALYVAMEQYAKAEPLYLRALAIAQKAEGPDHPSTGASLNNLAGLYRTTGQYEKAESLYLRALAIVEKTAGPEHPDTGASLNNVAGLYRSMGRYADALPLYRRALLIASNAGSPELAWRVQNNMSVAYIHEKHTDLAIFFGKQAVNTLQRMRTLMTPLDPALQRGFLTNKTEVYRGLADLLIEQGRLPEGQQVMQMLKEEEYFDFIRRDGKQDARTTEMAFNAGEEPWRKRYSEISGKLGSIGSELAELDRKARAGLSEAESARREQLRGDRKVAQQAFDSFLGDFMRELAGASAQRNRDVGERGLANLRALQGTLGSLGHNVVAVHYLVGEERLRILVTTPSIQVARSAAVSAKDLNQKIAFLQSQLQDPRLNPLPMAQELHKLLIAPIADDLKQAAAQTLMVSLDGTLRYIPLAALHDGARFVAESYRVALFTEAAKDKLKDVPQASWRVAALGLTLAKPGFSALPSVKGELEGIIKSGTRGALPGEMHLDEAFTAKRMRDALDKTYPVLHVASHFKFQPGTEANSFLLLGDGSKLTLKDIKEDDYHFNDVDLMTLSACETAVGGGKDANGMEIEGLGALVQKQGAKAVIATLWPVADESTGLLMQQFYSLRESGKLTKAEALRQAQLEFIQGKHKPGEATAQRGLDTPNAPKPTASSYTHPYYWAPFILMGNWL